MPEKKKRHSNISVFIPHNGCPHQCAFCNQRTISGAIAQPTADDVRRAVNTALASPRFDGADAEIAFFGGSFTAVDRDYMIGLLEAAHEYIAQGKVAGIRVSTRPDAIDDGVLTILKQYGVTSIELGAQSMRDEVLEMNRRGHTASDVINASVLIKEYGFSLGLQMMTGLYQSSDEKDIYTARKIADLQPDTVRIYPTIVMHGTELAELYQNGLYTPQTLETAVPLCAELLQFFEEKHINVIRLGLHDSDSLKQNMLAGAYHPAFRELCESEILFKNTLSLLKSHGISGGTVEFSVNPKSVSRFVGQKKCNLQKLTDMGITPVIRQNNNLSKYECEIRNEE